MCVLQGIVSIVTVGIRNEEGSDFQEKEFKVIMKTTELKAGFQSGKYAEIIERYLY